MVSFDHSHCRLLRLAAEEFRSSLRSLPDDTSQRAALSAVLVILATRTHDRQEALIAYSKVSQQTSTSYSPNPNPVIYCILPGN